MWTYVRVPRGAQVYILPEGYASPVHAPQGSRGHGPRGHGLRGHGPLGYTPFGHAPPRYGTPGYAPPGNTTPGDGQQENHHPEQSTEYTAPVYEYDENDYDHGDHEDDEEDGEVTSSDSTCNNYSCNDHPARQRNSPHGEGYEHHRECKQEWETSDKTGKGSSRGRGRADRGERGFSQRQGRADRTEREFSPRGGHARHEHHAEGCRERFGRSSSRAQPNRPPRHQRHNKPSDKSNEYESPRKEVINHYKTLGVPWDSSTKDIAKAAKEMRVKVHPDKLIKLGMPETEIGKINDTAARVGQAAEILLDPVKRAEHDEELRGHYGAE